MAIKAIPLAGIAVGCLFAYSGIKGAAITKSIGEIIQGKAPSNANAYPVSGSVDGSSAIGGTTSTGGLAGTAASYAGKVPYVWGGASLKGWDCSGMVNYVLGTLLKHAIPGSGNGSFSGHGPTTIQYEVWTGATTIPRAQAASGDLACWPTHIGICISNSEMVSAVDEAQGTAITTIQGPAGEPLTIRRIT